MAYTDELEPLLSVEQDLRLMIAQRIAEEAGAPTGATANEEHTAAADEAIASWAREDEDDHDMRAFRPLGPLQKLLVAHADLVDRIIDIRDRRLS
ncbi:hypothetical protein [Bosea lathyri]|uniref:Uncharacterized protein n=1 Tax=Bosea lathyri TaxID=1036778 RepID=A0A1H6DFT0_9HYPH|nr:hypothetical protein [Bosea lathyri]SEG83446.1 hypothetical protein SAMN04488115_1235 [Bosea lathyri]